MTGSAPEPVAFGAGYPQGADADLTEPDGKSEKADVAKVIEGSPARDRFNPPFCGLFNWGNSPVACLPRAVARFCPLRPTKSTRVLSPERTRSLTAHFPPGCRVRVFALQLTGGRRFPSLSALPFRCSSYRRRERAAWWWGCKAGPRVRRAWA
jgi:hypothetical protein